MQLIAERATLAHAQSLLRDVRQVDREEWVGACLRRIEDTLPEHVEKSGELAMAAVHPDGTTLSLWGALPSDHPEVGCAWLVSTNRAYHHVLGHHRHFKAGLKAMHDRYRVLMAWAWWENTVHHQWMEHFGFRRSGRWAYFTPGFKFIEFVHEVTPCASQQPAS